MEEVWNGVLRELAVPDEIADKWWQKIVAQYSETSRIYHNMENCLAQKFQIYDELVKDNITEQSAFILAMFFQHFEYDTKVYGGCIDKNVEQVKEFFKDAGIDHEGLISEVVGLLGAGREGGCGGEGANAYFQDLDLASLGAPHEEYRKYIEDVEREYADTPSNLYRTLRLKVLQTLLLIPKIYSTDVFYDKFESTARENIEFEINEMLQ